jgi:alpha-L-fucosidase
MSLPIGAIAMTHALLALAALSLVLAAPVVGAGPQAPHTHAHQEDRMDWWREARFGLFIHWGLYAIPAGEWDGQTNHAEWIRTTARIPLERYEQFLGQFNPVKFDADAWVRMAKDAGMGYIVITSKHHDGFALFDSKLSEFDVMATPFGRDIMKELAEACRRHGLRMCWYHSIMDWHHPDYLPRRDWEVDRPAAGAEFARFVEYLHGQVTELLTNYGPIGVMWFDGEWEHTWTHEEGRRLYELCRRLQPAVIVNNRVDKGRAGMAGMTTDAKYSGDFGTPEQEVPATGFPGVDWESCMTMNQNWGYNRHDRNWKSSREIIRMLVDIASKGGNLLLNVGPTALGEFPPESVERLAAVGRWMRVNGEAIHGSGASPFPALPWGRVTTRPKGEVTRLFLHVFDWPADGRLVVPGLGSQPLSAYLLSQPGQALEVSRVEGDVVIEVPAAAPDADCTVVTLAVHGAPIVYQAPELRAAADIFVREIAIEAVSGSKDLAIHYTQDGTPPTAASPRAAPGGRILLRDSATVSARLFHQGKPVSGVTSRTFTRVTPRPAAAAPAATQAGLECAVYAGEWDRMPDFAGLVPQETAVVPALALPAGPARERVGRRYSGYLLVPRDDVYVFELTSDDGAILRVGGEVVVDNDGLHGPLGKRGVAALAAGLHPLVLEWFNKTGGATLELHWGAVGEALTQVPPQALRSGRGG